MVSLIALWLPILLAAVLIFIVSTILHVVLPWHKNDFKRLANEDAVLDALRSLGLSPGDYAAPLHTTTAEANSPEYKAKVERGPQIVMTVVDPKRASIPLSLVLWFVYSVVVGIFAAYVAGAMLGPGAEYMNVFRITSTVAFVGYALALWQSAIWYSRSIGATLRATVDGLIYALLTGGVFGWLWP